MTNARYGRLHETSLGDREAFWLDAAGAIDWQMPPSRAFDDAMGVYGRWFPDAVGNMCHNAVDRHVIAGHGDRAAIIYDSPVTDRSEAMSYAALRDEIVALAHVMIDQGVSAGDRVLIYMPMIPQALVAMLACARIGAVHAVVFGGFAPPELASRIDDAMPKLILSATCGIEANRVIAYRPLLDAALGQARHKPAACIMFERDQAAASPDAMFLDWQTLVDRARAGGAHVPCAPTRATDPLYILYTSGTTGRPKGVVRDVGGYMVALAWSMKGIYDIDPGDVFWAASDIGWVVGHSYIVYGPLLAGATTILYEGKPVSTPDASAFPRVIRDHGVDVLFTAPTALRAIRGADAAGDHWNRLAPNRPKAIFLAGERADPATLQWGQETIGVPVIDHWWQTETGWPIAALPNGIAALPVKIGTAGLAMPGYEVVIRSADNRVLGPGEVGNVTISLPLPPGCLPTLWNDDERFRHEYLETCPGSYDTKDRGLIDEDGYLVLLGRSDDVINVAGHRLSTSVFEDIIAKHPDVAECAVIGLPDAIKGEVPFALVVSRSALAAAALTAQLVERVRSEFGPVGALRQVVLVPSLPKTRSGKVMRGFIRTVLMGDAWTMPGTIEDTTAVDELIRLAGTLQTT
jgi:propionyl-CoA synthetase